MSRPRALGKLTAFFVVFNPVAVLLIVGYVLPRFADQARTRYLRDRVVTMSKLSRDEQIQRLNILKSWTDRSIQMWLLRKDGQVLASTSNQPVPEKARTILSTRNDFPIVNGGFLQEDLLIHEESNYSRFLIAQFQAPPWSKIALRNTLLISLALTIGLALLGFFSTGLIFIGVFIKRRSQEAERILHEIRSGNLKARFSVNSLDHLDHTMLEFNRLADELEAVTEKLRRQNQNRSEVLRELAHDLQTPLTTITCLVENVAEEATSLSAAEISERMDDAARELHYFKRLIEDLFLLEQMEVSMFALSAADASEIVALVEGEIARQKDRIFLLGLPSVFFTMRIDAFESGTRVNLNSQLLRRLVRNALENAQRFAREKVEIILRITDRVELFIRDDGPGFSAEALKGFGEPKAVRLLEVDHAKRIPLGLGSKIITKIAAHLGGKIVPANRLDRDGSILGAELKLMLPGASEAPSLPRAAGE